MEVTRHDSLIDSLVRRERFDTQFTRLHTNGEKIGGKGDLGGRGACGKWDFWGVVVNMWEVRIVSWKNDIVSQRWGVKGWGVKSGVWRGGVVRQNLHKKSSHSTGYIHTKWYRKRYFCLQFLNCENGWFMCECGHICLSSHSHYTHNIKHTRMEWQLTLAFIVCFFAQYLFTSK